MSASHDQSPHAWAFVASNMVAARCGPRRSGQGARLLAFVDLVDARGFCYRLEPDDGVELAPGVAFPKGRRGDFFFARQRARLRLVASVIGGVGYGVPPDARALRPLEMLWADETKCILSHARLRHIRALPVLWPEPGRLQAPDRHASMGDSTMRSVYSEDDDILKIRVSGKRIVREVCQGWNTHVSYADDGTIVEIVLLDAKKEGLVPMQVR